jgi:hypothetical protein
VSLLDNTVGSVVFYLFSVVSVLNTELAKQCDRASRFGPDLHPGPHSNGGVKVVSK